MASKPKANAAKSDDPKVQAMQAAAAAKRQENQELKDGIDQHITANDLQAWVDEQISGATSFEDLIAKLNDVVAAIDAFTKGMGKSETLLKMLRNLAFKSAEVTPEMKAVKKQLTSAKTYATKLVTALKSIQKAFSGSSGVRGDFGAAVREIMYRAAEAKKEAEAEAAKAKAA